MEMLSLLGRMICPKQSIMSVKNDHVLRLIVTPAPEKRGGN